MNTQVRGRVPEKQEDNAREWNRLNVGVHRCSLVSIIHLVVVPFPKR